jgi:hypothetical protein
MAATVRSSDDTTAAQSPTPGLLSMMHKRAKEATVHTNYRLCLGAPKEDIAFGVNYLGLEQSACEGVQRRIHRNTCLVRWRVMKDNLLSLNRTSSSITAEKSLIQITPSRSSGQAELLSMATDARGGGERILHQHSGPRRHGVDVDARHTCSTKESKPQPDLLAEWRRMSGSHEERSLRGSMKLAAFCCDAFRPGSVHATSEVHDHCRCSSTMLQQTIPYR